MHYNDLQEDLDAEMRRISSFIGIEVNEAVWPALGKSSAAAAFAAMQVAGRQADAPPADWIRRGAKRFFHKGTNGRWRNALSCDDLALYNAKSKSKSFPLD